MRKSASDCVFLHAFSDHRPPAARQSANWNVAISVSAVNDAPTLYLAPGTWSCRSWEALYLGQVSLVHQSVVKETT